MPALPKDKLAKRVQTPSRIHPRSFSNVDVKRLGPNRRMSSKRPQTQSIQTQTILACLIIKDNQTDEGSQTAGMNTIDNYVQNPVNRFATRLVKFFGGTIVSFMKFFNNMK